MKAYFWRVLGPQKPVDQDVLPGRLPIKHIKAQYILYLTISLALTYYKIVKPMHLTEACLGITL